MEIPASQSFVILLKISIDAGLGRPHKPSHVRNDPLDQENAQLIEPLDDLKFVVLSQLSG
jgi:hypothetical protein